jgi:hypothetical protein
MVTSQSFFWLWSSIQLILILLGNPGNKLPGPLEIVHCGQGIITEQMNEKAICVSVPRVAPARIAGGRRPRGLYERGAIGSPIICPRTDSFCRFRSS